MRLRSRRLLWGFNCLLLLVAAVIFRPIRTWIDQAVIARVIHPELSVQEIHLHHGTIEAGLSVVEAKQFGWSGTYGDRSFGISAERAWIVIDNESLIDKVVTIPKAVLQQSKLYMETIPLNTALAAHSTSTPSGSIWQQQLNSRFGDLEWHDLKQHFDSVLKLDSFAIQCCAEIETWVANSEKIATKAQSLNIGQDGFANPLRDQADLQNRLAKLEPLIAQEKALRSDFGKLESIVNAKLEEIDTQLDAQVSKVREQAKRVGRDVKQRIVDQLLIQAGDRILGRFKYFAEVADLMCRASTRETGLSADADYRAPDQHVLSLRNFVAAGVFGVGDLKAPFWMQSECVRTTKSPAGNVARANFRYQFNSNPYTVKLVASSRLETSELIDLQIEILPLAIPATEMTSSSQAAISISSAQWVVGSNGQSISGELCIDRRLLPFLTDGNLGLTSAINHHLESLEMTGEDLSNLTVEVGGTWALPTLTVIDHKIPPWLESIIDAQLDQQIQHGEQQMVAKLEEHVASEVDRIGKLLDERLSIAQEQTARHSEGLTKLRSSLESKQTGQQNSEFARSTQEEVKR